MTDKKIFVNTKVMMKDYLVKDIVVVDLDKTIIDSDSFLYKIFNIGFGKKRVLSAIRTASQKYKARLFDFDKAYKKSILNTLIGILNPSKYVEIPNAIKNVNKLSKDYYIFLVTSRPMSKSLNYLLINTIKKLDIHVDFVIADCADKGKCCQMLNAKFLIDNSLNYCVDAAANKKTKSICFNQKRIGEYKNILHLGDWDRIYDYIKYIDPLLEKKESPAFTKWGDLEKFREKVGSEICSFKQVELSCIKNKENTK